VTGSETRAVLDTNILLAAESSKASASPNREVFDRWLAGEFTLPVSDDVAAEYADRLARMGKTADEIAFFLARVFLLGETVEITFFHFRHYPADPEDIGFLLCAINGQATHLVTYDRHLQQIAPFYPDFVTCEPLVFLRHLRAVAS